MLHHRGLLWNIDFKLLVDIFLWILNRVCKMIEIGFHHRQCLLVWISFERKSILGPGYRISHQRDKSKDVLSRFVTEPVDIGKHSLNVLSLTA